MLRWFLCMCGSLDNRLHHALLHFPDCVLIRLTGDDSDRHAKGVTLLVTYAKIGFVILGGCVYIASRALSLRWNELE